MGSEMAQCILGNFNEIVTQDEKIGGRSRPRKQMEDFRLALERNGLVDLGWKNQKFTQSNKHTYETFTKERLDRVVANENWLTMFGNPGVDILTTCSSYHCPLVLNTTDYSSGPLRRRRIFRYETKRALEENEKQAIRLASQNMNFSPNCWINIHSKLLH